MGRHGYRMRAVLFFSACVLLACGEEKDSASTDYDGPVNSCRSDNDCAPDACDIESGICVVLNSASPALIARIVPTVQSTVVSQYFSVQPSPGMSIVLPLRSPVEVFDIGLTFNGTVIFEELISVVEGLSTAVSVYKARTNDPSEFFLLPGDYRVSLIPDEAEGVAPPHYLSFVRVTEEGFFVDEDGAPIAVDLPLVEEGYPVLTGRVKYELAPDQILPANGLQVLAREQGSNRIVSTRSRSRCTTAASCGEFDILLPENIESVSLEISKPEEPFHPVFHFAVNDLEAAADGSYLIPYPSVPVLFEGEVKVQSGEGEPPAAPPPCQVLFELLSEDGTRSLSYWGRTGDNGFIESSEGLAGVYLYPGDYRITVFPAGDDRSRQDEYAVFESDFTVSDSGDGADSGIWTATLVPRKRVSGKVSINGEAVADTTVSATPLAGESPSVRSTTTRSDSDGAFAMPLDRGSYYLVSSAPPQSGFAAGLSLIDGSSGFDDAPVDLSLSVPLVVEGEIVPPDQDDNEQLIGIAIEWYRPYGDKVFLVGRTSVSVDGRFRSLLPP